MSRRGLQWRRRQSSNSTSRRSRRQIERHQAAPIRGATLVDSSHVSSRSHQGLLSMHNLKKIRTDVVGSLQRPPLLKDARAKYEGGKLSAAEFRTIEDEA